MTHRVQHEWILNLYAFQIAAETATEDVWMDKPSLPLPHTREWQLSCVMCQRAATTPRHGTHGQLNKAPQCSGAERCQCGLGGWASTYLNSQISGKSHPALFNTSMAFIWGSCTPSEGGWRCGQRLCLCLDMCLWPLGAEPARSLPRPGLLSFILYLWCHQLCPTAPRGAQSKCCHSGQKYPQTGQVSVQALFSAVKSFYYYALPRHVQHLVNIFLGSS